MSTSDPEIDPAVPVTDPSPELNSAGLTSTPSAVPSASLSTAKLASPSTGFSAKVSPPSSSSSSSEHSRFNRPRLANRKSSGTIIVPRDHPNVDTPGVEYPPDDARAMSPRRSSVEMEQLGYETRMAIQEQVRKLQTGLVEIAESIEMVKHDHEKLEKQNLALQDYIGGLTRSMSKNDIGASKGKK